jgi:aspartate/tyrosine/aromatic aminotransferase
MASPITPIYTQTVGSGGALSIAFNNIPQFYTDLKVVISGRTTGGGV